MPIEWNQEARQLHLHNGSVSFVMRALESAQALQDVVLAQLRRVLFFKFGGVSGVERDNLPNHVRIMNDRQFGVETEQSGTRDF